MFLLLENSSQDSLRLF